MIKISKKEKKELLAWIMKIEPFKEKVKQLEAVKDADIYITIRTNKNISIEVKVTGKPEITRIYESLE